MDLLKALLIVCKARFIFEDNSEEKIKEYFKKAFRENRFVFLDDTDKTRKIGFLVYFLYNKDEAEQRVKNNGTFIYPDHNPSGDCIFIDSCVIFDEFQKVVNLLYLRKFFLDKFPQIRYVYWHKSIGDKKKLFRIKYGGYR